MAFIDSIDAEVVRGIVADWWHVLAVGGGALYLTTKAVYRRFFNPLANVPGPFLPAVTRLWAWYHNVPREGKLFLEIERLHSIYGKQHFVNLASTSIRGPCVGRSTSWRVSPSTPSHPPHRVTRTNNQHAGIAQCRLSAAHFQTTIHTVPLRDPHILHADAFLQAQSSASPRMRCI